MAGPPDGTAPGWDALAPASGSDALAVSAADARSATYVAASADALAVGYRADALAVGYRADALAVGYRTDALAAGDAPATGDPLATPMLGDTFGDSLTAYGDATAADRPDTRRAPGRRTPRPGPVPPGAASTDDRSPGDSARGRAADRAAKTGPADAGRQPRRGAPTPGPRRAARPGVGGSTTTTGRTGRSAYGGGRAGGGGSAAAGRRQPTWEDLGRIGAQGPPGGGTPPTSGARYGGPPRDVPGPRGQGPVPTSPRWANRTSRPTGTVPWAGPSGRSGWDDFVAGMGGTSGGSGKQPSGAEVARALLAAFRRSLRDR